MSPLKSGCLLIAFKGLFVPIKGKVNEDHNHHVAKDLQAINMISNYWLNFCILLSSFME